MKIHHLNCGSFCPLGGRLINGPPAQGVCHCLAIETSDGLVLVDTGFGTQMIREANSHIPPWMRKLVRPLLDENETALCQVQQLGFSEKDVRHIVLTHLDFDHAGGLSDFPHAKVHVFGAEFIAAMSPATWLEKKRYNGRLWKHHPQWEVHRTSAGENWFGFDCVRQMTGLPPEILLIPLEGHTWGHCGVAVRTSSGWILHAGDAYFYHKELNTSPECTPGLSGFQSIAEVDKESRLYNQKRLRDLKREQGQTIKIFCSHDPTEFKDASLSHGGPDLELPR